MLGAICDPSLNEPKSTPLKAKAPPLPTIQCDVTPFLLAASWKALVRRTQVKWPVQGVVVTLFSLAEAIVVVTLIFSLQHPPTHRAAKQGAWQGW